LEAPSLLPHLAQLADHGGELLPLLVQAGEPVQVRQVGIWSQQRLVVALAVDVYKRVARALEHREGHSASVEACRASAVGADLPAEDEDVLGLVQLDVLR